MTFKISEGRVHNIDLSSQQKKCEQYWPDEGTQKYGDLSVLLVNTTKYSDFVIRTFELSKVCNERGEIILSVAVFVTR